MEEKSIDEAAAEQFAERVFGMVNDAMACLMISIGHRTGLFDAMVGLPPSTSEQVAAAAGLNERYVREWLGAMVTSRIVDYDPPTRAYHLPTEHAASLTRAAGIGNLAMQTQYLALLGGVEGKIVDCFHRGGGVPYSAFPDFQRLMAEESAQVADATLLDVTLPLVDGLVERLRAGIDAADVGCGSGHALNLMAERFPHSRFVGFDVSAEGLAAGQAEAATKGLTNVRFEARDAAELGEDSAFDLITTFDSIHDQVYPDRALRGISSGLRPGGVYLCVDIRASSDVADNVDLPTAPYLYTVSTMHCMTVSLAQDGAGLGTVWGEQVALRMLADAGFTDVQVKTVEGDLFNNYYVARKTEDSKG